MRPKYSELRNSVSDSLIKHIYLNIFHLVKEFSRELILKVSSRSKISFILLKVTVK